jgi:hypothetical protein
MARAIVTGGSAMTDGGYYDGGTAGTGFDDTTAAWTDGDSESWGDGVLDSATQDLASAADSAVAVADEVESYVDRTLAEFKRAFGSYKYGSYCGPGVGGSPIDDIDSCCQTHDGAYSAAGYTGNDLNGMFSADGVLATEAADSALVHCLNATITGPHWHDPAAIAYREAAIALFGARAAVAEYVKSQRTG